LPEAEPEESAEALMWLESYGLANDEMTVPDQVRRYKALSKCQFGD